ncbi:TIGR02186 family protein [Aurantiacibacter sp. MUD61]|uniref:TIGR02186 family protein n=1 Tax=Aurantiacibacter sp. MUD61 TaxID=3009083 RepID=UPI0022F050B0|nr:TIGR02186 family protein [Aurantiacibacter sp. MUD61]
MRALFAFLLALMLAAPAAAQSRDPILVPDISEHEIVLRQGFTGADLLLFGAILDPRGDRADGQYDVVVVLKGPSEQIRLREKERWLGLIWVNAESSDFRSVPSYYALASSRPIANIVDERTALIFELGLDYLQLSPSGSIDPDEQARFSAGLVDLRQRQGLYAEYESGVVVSEGVLYRARLPIPSNVIAGRYVAETFAIADGRVITSATSEVQVFKEGFERRVEEEANNNALLYGLIAVGLSVFMGWAAGRLFALV